MRITPRDRQVLDALCNRVRVLSLTQIACAWWSGVRDAERGAALRLSKLAEVDLVRCWSVLARPLPLIHGPELSWSPGEPDPDFGAVAWALQSRWTEGPGATPVYVGTKRSAGILGGRAVGQPKAPLQATHDLGVGEMFVRVLLDRPELLPRWVGEDVLKPYRKNQKLPDAVIADGPAANPELVLEFGGAYDKRRVTAFHRDCERRQVPYEVW